MNKPDLALNNLQYVDVPLNQTKPNPTQPNQTKMSVTNKNISYKIVSIQNNQFTC